MTKPKWYFIALLVLSTLNLLAQAKFPDPSPKQIIIQEFGLSKIELEYSRPGAKGRDMIGYIEPYGNIWRTGANRATRITFHHPVIIGNTRVNPGLYAIYSIPQEEKWTIKFNKGVDNWGSDGYDPQLNEATIIVDVEVLAIPVETMSFQFHNVKPASCDLVLSWENWSITIPIKASIRDDLRKIIENDLSTTSPNYWHAAQFYYEYDNKLHIALKMINDAIEAGESKGLKAYWYYYYKAWIMADMGRKKGP